MNFEKNILIVDDDIHLQSALKRALLKNGYLVKTANSIAGCRAQLMESVPGLILLDVVLPDGTGTDFIKELRSGNLYETVGIFLMSGLKTDNDFVEEGLNSGALYFVRKPFNLNDLIQQINLIFKVRQLEHNRLQSEERLNHFFNNANDILFIIDNKGKILNISKSYEEITGIPVSITTGKNFSTLLAEPSQGNWINNMQIINEGGILPSFEILFINTFENVIPVDILLTKSTTVDGKDSVLVGIAKDLRTIKLLEANSGETENYTNRELEIWEKMTVPSTRLTEITYEVSAFTDEKSEIFINMVNAYRQLIDLAIEQRIYKIERENKLKQRMYANELGFLKAGPKDLIKIHTTFFKTLDGKLNSKKAAIYHEEARIILLAVMGYLVSFYRNKNYSTTSL